MDDLLTSRVIGYDAKRAVANFTGLGNYSRFIISSMAERLPDSRLRLYIPNCATMPIMPDCLNTETFRRTCLPDIIPAYFVRGGVPMVWLPTCGATVWNCFTG